METGDHKVARFHARVSVDSRPLTFSLPLLSQERAAERSGL